VGLFRAVRSPWPSRMRNRCGIAGFGLKRRTCWGRRPVNGDAGEHALTLMDARAADGPAAMGSERTKTRRATLTARRDDNLVDEVKGTLQRRSRPAPG